MRTISEYYIESYRILFFDEMSDYEKVIAELTEKLKGEQNSHGYNNLGVAHYEIGELDKALENFNLAIELNSENGIAYINRAFLNEKWNKIADAEMDYGKAIELNPTNATYWRSRAYLLKEKGALAKALSDFKRAKKIEPNFQQTINEITELEQSLGIAPKNSG